MADPNIDVASDALRWITAAAVPAGSGATWPVSRADGARLADDLYGGTAGVLVALAEARLTGITEFDDVAVPAARRLQELVLVAVAAGAATAGPAAGSARAAVAAGTAAAAPAAGTATAAASVSAGEATMPDRVPPGLYDGLAGYAWVLRLWASVSDDEAALRASIAATHRLAAMALGPASVSAFRDLLTGEAGVALVLLDAGDDSAWPAVGAIADRLVAAAQWDAPQWGDGEPDWYAKDDIGYFMPNLSHGAAGIASALGRAGMVLERSDLVDLAARAGHRLVRLGTRSDGTLAVPHSIPLADPGSPVSYGWCHGPAGTVRLFEVLERAQPGQGWADHAGACCRAVRASGLPERLYPGFWDNLGQCCGTAGVGEMAIDRYQDTGDPQWLEWAEALAADVVARQISDDAGVRWSQTDHKSDPSELEPMIGWMQGAAGIAGFLLRLARVRRDGVTAHRILWPGQ